MSIYRDKVLEAMLCMTRQCWEQGIAAQALMEVGEYEKLELVVYDMVLRQSEDGRLCNVENTPAITDSAFCIPATYLLAKKVNNPVFLKAAEKNIDFLRKKAERAEDGTLYHIHHSTEIWADSAAFLPYALALTGHSGEALEQFYGICRRLYNEETGLYYHMWNEEMQTYTRPLPWGIGNGWILTGALRLYLTLDPEYSEEKANLLVKYKTLLDSMLQYQSENHLFYDILNDPSSFEESESSAMVAYAIYIGLKQGILDPHYRKEADRIRTALYKKVTPSGLILDAASSPSFDKAGTAVECQAHFLMMEQAFDDLNY